MLVVMKLQLCYMFGHLTTNIAGRGGGETIASVNGLSLLVILK